MTPIDRARHILCRVEQRAGGAFVIHCRCTVCNDKFEWVCRGGKQMVQWRINMYVNMHLHGHGRPVYYPMPRG
jgi:hypothetical protein